MLEVVSISVHSTPECLWKSNVECCPFLATFLAFLTQMLVFCGSQLINVTNDVVINVFIKPIHYCMEEGNISLFITSDHLKSMLQTYISCRMYVRFLVRLENILHRHILPPRITLTSRR